MPVMCLIKKYTKLFTSVLNLYQYYYQGNQKNGVSRVYFLMFRWSGQLFCAFSDIVSVVVLKQTNKCRGL